MMPVSVIQQYIPSPTPVKPKLGFSIDEIVGNNTRAESPKFQSFSPSAVVKPDIPYNYSLTSPRTEVGNVIDSVTRYAQMYNNLPPELRANLDCLGITCPRLQISPTMSLLGTEMQPVHPWFANRHVRYYHPRIQGADSAAYLYHPFRKPKRVRTAFSPSQLLQLEHAFEKNHYVVGNERRQLADALNLTETQVKVWFQNRRTKHKRQKQDDGENCDDKAVDSHQEHSSSDDEATAFEERISEVTHDSSLWNPSDAKVSTSPKMSCETEFSS